MADKINNKDDYANLTYTPTADQLSLKLVLEYYDEYFEPYIYRYELENKDAIILKFAHSNFPHLIGIHYAPNEKYGRYSDEAKQFRGYAGYKGVKNGSIDKQKIKSMFLKKNEGYKNMTRKMRYFYNVHKILESPSAVYYNESANKGRKNSAIDCDIVLYKIINGQYVHVGLEKEGSKYVPKTFLIEPEPIFVEGQVVINIHKSKKVRHRRVK